LQRSVSRRTVASINVGASGHVRVFVEVSNAELPVDTGVCETDTVTGECLNPATYSARLLVEPFSTPTFAVFVTATGDIAPNSAENHLFVRFRDAVDKLRGATSIAVSTH
jgi:hypothetical protein|tara:strand:- start:2094 stop:2423 length:330 start_codon:yes stop_codon:yes gene_type:complete